MTDSLEADARIRISLATGDLEIEGSESFVSQYADSIEAVLEILRTKGASGPVAGPVPTAAPNGSSSPSSENGQATAPVGDDEPFGEVLHSLNTKSGTDQILLAGYYVSKNVADGTFATVEAHKLLIEQGIRLSNASQSLKNNITAKRAFKVGSRIKVSKIGMDYLKSLGAPVA